MSLSFANVHFVVVSENRRLLAPDDHEDDNDVLVAQRPTNALFFPLLLVLKRLLPLMSHPLKEDATEEAIVGIV